MKFKSISQFIVFLLVVCISVSSQAQTSDNHKTYSGPYGNRSRPYGGTITGTATYQYIDDPNGGRIYDGSFKYKDDEVTYTGNFKNNRQVGKWVYERLNKNNRPQALVKTVATLTFDENGHLNGPYSEVEHYRNGTQFIWVSTNLINNGWFDGKYIKDVHQSGVGIRKIKGQYKNGVRVGEWVIPWIDGVVNFDKLDSEGKLKVRKVDNSTGDIQEISYRVSEIFEEPNGFSSHSSEIPGLKSLLMRDSRIASFDASISTEKLSVYGRSWRREKTTEISSDFEKTETVKIDFNIPENNSWIDFLNKNYSLPLSRDSVLKNNTVTVNLLCQISDGKVKVLEASQKKGYLKEDVEKNIITEASRLAELLEYKATCVNGSKPFKGIVEIDMEMDLPLFSLWEHRETDKEKRKKEEARRIKDEELRNKGIISVPREGFVKYYYGKDVDTKPVSPLGDTQQVFDQVLSNMKRLGYNELLKKKLEQEDCRLRPYINITIMIGTDGNVEGISESSATYDEDLNQMIIKAVKDLPSFTPAYLIDEPVRFILELGGLSLYKQNYINGHYVKTMYLIK
ncbi:MAG: hypothetical protein K2N79_02815 [Muribaculaceae bacterium]|nr:hypothetical protein [Muribaculaceae bacterium]